MNTKGWQYSEETKTLIGTSVETWINESTGERAVIQSIHKRIYGSKQFWKVYLVDFLQILGVLDSKQVDILIYILENTEQANNTFIGTYTRIQKEVGVSAPTVAKVITKLQEKGFLRKVQNGVWQVSPRIMLKGNDHKKQILLNYYREDEKEKETDFEAADAMKEQTATVEPAPQPPETCKICGAVLEERIRRDDGKKFWGCPNWRRDDHRRNRKDVGVS